MQSALSPFSCGYCRGAATAISSPTAVPAGVEGGGDMTMVMVVVVNNK